MMTPSVRLALPLLLAAFVGQGCVYVTQKVREEKELEVDQDRDGAPFAGPGADCDDLDPDRTPGAEELPYDGIDNDCSGNADLVDQDRDGFPGISREAWEELTGRSADDGGPGGWPNGVADEVDCLDEDVVDADGNVLVAGAAVFPGNAAGELPYDGIDSDCGQDNDFDLDGDEYIPDPLPGGVGGDAQRAFETYVTDWGYEDLQNDWFPNQGGPSYGDCDDADANTYPGNPVDEPYDGFDSNCLGDNDFDPDGDGYMPPFLPGTNTPTEPAFTAFVQRYDLEFTLPEDVIADPSGVKNPVVLGAFDDCLDLGDPRVGAGALDAASIYPRPYSPTFGDNGDIPYDGIDTDCNRDNDFDQDRDAYIRTGDDSAFAEYIAFWGYEDEQLRWAEVNPDVQLSAPGPDDCADLDPLTYPAALELIERDGTPVDQDCDGDENGSSFWFQGSQAAPVMEWKGITNPRVTRLGDVYAIIVGANVLNQTGGVAETVLLNVGVAIPFPIDVARSQAVPSQPPYAWKSQSATQVIGPVIDVVSIDRCRDPLYPDQELAFAYVEHVTAESPTTYFSAFALKEAVTGRSITVRLPIDVIGSVAPAMEANGVTLSVDGSCNLLIGAISDDAIWVSHGKGQISDLPLYTDLDPTGSLIVPSFLPSDATGAYPIVSFEVCETGVCSDHYFNLDPAANNDPIPPAPPNDIVPTSNSWSAAVASWNKTEDRVTTAIPFGALGLEVLVELADGSPPTSLQLFNGEQVVSAHGQWHDGELYVVAIVDDGVSRQVLLAYGVPGSLDITPLNYDPDDLPDAAANARPDQVALFVDDDRIAVAMTMEDPTAGPTVNADAIGWLFLGPPQ